LGPSGCGKTTLLRMIAGFNTVDGGEICFDQQVINTLPAHKRDIGMVFQNYAIFPHLNVADNVAYGLKARKVPKEQIVPRVDEALKMVQIDQLKTRQPNELSGGQQQRVALARAFVIEPGVLLMDEPLSNLDAKLRVQMRTTIKKLQRRLGITTVYVTHDQEEALAISDRIAVMNQGNIMQIGKPEEIYRKPANPFVANFIGVSNFIDCSLDGQDPKAAVVKLHDGHSFQMPLRAPYSGEVILSARPEQLFFSETGLPGRVNMSTFLGDFIQYEVELSTGQVLELNEYTKDVDGAKNDGEEVHISFDPRRVSLYRKDTEEVLSC
ncbi:MAG: ABC transporter ATP-binding protein, partial [Oscillospiraceae bacterium]|nr:ABC transporter ATP-binding protein [Oscillospiraceae bacterium]